MSLALRCMSRIIASARPEMRIVDGARLGRLGDAAWVADREIGCSGRHSLPLRMVVLRDATGMLTLYAPVLLDDGTREALAGLGRVARVIVPNRFHTHFAPYLMQDYPHADILLPQESGGLAGRFDDRARTLESPEQLDAGLEVWPVRLCAGLDELVAYHDPSETLILCDLVHNFQQASSGLARWLYRLNGVWRRPGISRLQRLLLKDRQSLGDFYRWAMSKPFSQISMAHGHLLQADARETFYQLFRGYGR